MDQFKQLQHLCIRVTDFGRQRKRRKWGCPCCMKMSPQELKWWSRRMAKRRLKMADLASFNLAFGHAL